MNSLTVHRSKRLAAVAVATLSLLLASVAPAVAQDTSTSRGYNKQGPSIQGQVQEGSADGVTPQEEAGGTPEATAADTPRKAEAGTLPFTGFEASVVFAAGLALVGVGFGLRRVARTTT